MKTTKEKIEEIQTNGYNIDFANVFNHAFENYKKIALYAGLMIFVFAILFGFLAGGIVILTFGVSALNQKMLENVTAENFTGLHLAIYLIVGILFNCLFVPFSAGLIKMADSAEKDEEFHVSTVFQYYKNPYFQELVIATFLITIFSTGLSEMFKLVGIEIIGALFSAAISFFTFLTIPLIIFGNLKAIAALKSSMIIVVKQPLVLLGLLIVSGIASLVGFIGCCIGVFFTIPFLYSMYYAIYTSIIGIDSENGFE